MSRVHAKKCIVAEAAFAAASHDGKHGETE